MNDQELMNILEATKLVENYGILLFFMTLIY